MTWVFYLYYFIDNWAGVVLVRRVSMHLVSSRFPIVSISASGSYFEKRRSKEQILVHCCHWLIQPCGKRPRPSQMEPLGLNHSLSQRNGGFLGFWRVPSFLSPLQLGSVSKKNKSFLSNKVLFQSVMWPISRKNCNFIINWAAQPFNSDNKTSHNSQL